jgi:hypothetical protein
MPNFVIPYSNLDLGPDHPWHRVNRTYRNFQRYFDCGVLEARLLYQH